MSDAATVNISSNEAWETTIDPRIIARLKGSFEDQPEQYLVVGPLVQRLLDLGWNLEQIIFGKREWRVPKSPSETAKREKGHHFDGWPVDIAVFERPELIGDYRGLLFIVECKRPDETSGLEQLDTYFGREPHLRLGVWANNPDEGAPAVFLFRDEKDRTHPQKKTVSALPRPDAVIDKDYRALRGEHLLVPSRDVLTRVLEELLNKIVAMDARVTRREEQLDQLCNVILIKLASDKEAKLSPRKEVAFRPAASPGQTGEALRRQFARLIDIFPDIFTSDDDRTLRFSDSTLDLIVNDLAPLNLLGVGPDVLSVAFQVLRSAALKQKEGQYFTPQPVIAAAVHAVDISSANRILDPACGTGGFLVEAMVAKREEVEAQGGDTNEVVRWAQLALYGIDKDATAVKLTKAVMQIMGDGSSNCARGDSVATHLWATEYPHLIRSYKNGSFELIFTNPPFGAPLKIKRADARKAGLTIADGLNAGKDLELGLAMLDRCYQLLREDGRLCIVLPETYFFSPSYRFVRDWCYERFAPEVVINVAMEAFAGFCRAKTNIYVFRKLRSYGEIRDKAERQRLLLEQRQEVAEQTVIMLNPRTCGVYKNGSIRYKVDEHGERLAEIDNEMLDHVMAYRRGELPPGAVAVPIGTVIEKDVLVPAYYDTRKDAAFNEVIERLGVTDVTLGELLAEGLIYMRGGHGSVSNDQRVGGVPYVKVSDIRALRVNINPTNMIPLALARKKWRNHDDSGLQPWDLITPNRASSNIGEFAVLLPGETKIVLTKEMFVIRVTDKGAELFDAFYLMWALSLKSVREQWRRLTLMQTNREDVGDRYLELRLPLPPSRAWADEVSAHFRSYFQQIAASKSAFLASLKGGTEEYIGSIYLDADPELVEEAQIEEGLADESVLTDIDLDGDAEQES